MEASETAADSDARTDRDPKQPNALARLVQRVIAWALARKIVRAALLYVERRGPMLADSITYRTLFSIFAGVLLGFSVAGLWLSGNPAALNALIDAVDAAVPGLFGDDGVLQPEDVQVSVGLSLAGLVSLVALVGAALGAIGSLRTAVRTVAGTLEKDVLFIWVMLRNLGLAIGIGMAFVASAALTFIGRLGVTWITDLLGVPEDSVAVGLTVRALSLLIVFALDVALIIGVFRVLSGVRPSARALWPGALLGGAGLLVLQELSSLFVGGASSNPLLASFASLLALLIWLNLSAQVILVASAYIVTGVEEEGDRLHARYGARTFAQRRVQRAEQEVAVATAALRAARDAEREERAGSQS